MTGARRAGSRAARNGATSTPSAVLGDCGQPRRCGATPPGAVRFHGDGYAVRSILQPRRLTRARLLHVRRPELPHPRHIACLTSTGAGKGAVNVTVSRVGCAQPLTLHLTLERFAEITRALEAACRGGAACPDGKTPA